MEIIKENGIVYTKASVLAKKFRYTSDYIGQLCRQGKVDCHLVGRSWYVSESSLLGHKDARYKDTKSVRIDEKTILNKDDSNKIQVKPRLSKLTSRQTATLSAHKNFEQYLLPVSSKYFSDETELLPQPLRRINPVVPTLAKLPVLPSEAEDLKISETVGDSEKLEFTAVPEVYLQGNLTVQDVDFDSLDSDSTPVSLSDVAKNEPIVPEVPTASALKATKVEPKPVRSREIRFSPQQVLATSAATDKSLLWLIVLAFFTSTAFASFVLLAVEEFTVTGNHSASIVRLQPEYLLSLLGILF